MSWWSKNKRILLSAVAITLFLTVAVVVSIAIFRPAEFGQICTLVGCGGGINVELSGLPASTPYQVILSFPSGETSAISCDPGAEDNPNSFEKSCSSNGAYFSLEPDTLPPDEVTVKVVVGENQVLQVFHPVYEKLQPNGVNCAPTCYNAVVKMSVSQ
jgi:hypothetical protein